MFIDFRDRGKARERERERHIHVRNIDRLPPVHAPNGDGTCNLGMYPDQGLNPQPFGVRNDTSTN